MIDKRKENQVFTLTKDHSIKYLYHTYYKKKFVPKIIK